MFIKFCGITRAADARAAADVGADAIGLNFVPTSRRVIDLSVAEAILRATPHAVMSVGVFRNQPIDEVLRIARALGLDAAQLHGDESPESLAEIAAHVKTIIKVHPADRLADRSVLDRYDATVTMIDAPTPGAGVPFNWNLVGDLVHDHRVLLAGGLTSANVADAIRIVRPWGVDVASGVESSPGLKDPVMMTRFVSAARSAN